MPRRSLPRFSVNKAGEWKESVPVLREVRYSQSLERGLAILGCFTPDKPVLGIAKIADILGMSRSTTHRYVITLVELGYVEQVAGRKYRLTLSVTSLGLGAMNGMSLKEHASALLRELHERTNFTVSIAVLDGPAIEYVDQILATRSGHRHPLKIPIGSHMPIHNTAMGKLLVAYLPARLRSELINELTLTKTGPKTITNKKRLRQGLEEIPDGGIAVADQELLPGLVAIAAPIRDMSHEVVAAVSMTSDRAIIDVDTLAEQLGPHLIAIADRISARLGYRREDQSPSGLNNLHSFALEGDHF